MITDCNEAEITGKYFLQLPDNSSVFPVVCEVETFDGDWLVIQQRITGGLEFKRDWEDYKNGFGFIGKSTEFWLGLERVHQLTKEVPYDLAVELRNEAGQYGYALFSNFQIADEDDYYRLNKGFRHIDGTIGRGMSFSYGEGFSTFDNDNDQSSFNCGHKYKSGWWFYECKHTNLNGPFKKDPETGRGIFWNNFTAAATYCRMMIRRPSL